MIIHSIVTIEKNPDEFQESAKKKNKVTNLLGF